MKKATIIAMVLVLLTLGTWPKERLSINIHLTSNISMDEGYKKTYGAFHLGADATCAWNFFNHFTLWGGIGIIPAFSTIPELEDRASSIQFFLQLGLGFNFKLFSQLYINLHAGPALVIYAEKTMGISPNDSAFGFEGGLDFKVPLKKKLFFNIFTDYLYCQDRYNNKDMLPGGLRCGLGIGWRF